MGGKVRLVLLGFKKKREKNYMQNGEKNQEKGHILSHVVVVVGGMS